MTAQQFSSLVGYLACRRLAFAAEGLIVGGRSKNGEVMIQEGGGAADDTVDMYHSQKTTDIIIDFEWNLTAIGSFLTTELNTPSTISHH